MISSSDEFWRIIDKRVIEPIYTFIKCLNKKFFPHIISFAKSIVIWNKKRFAITMEIIKEWRHPGQRKLEEEKLIELATLFHRSIILLEITSGRDYWLNLYKRKKEDSSFQQEHIALEEYGLIESVDEYVCNSKPTKLGYRVAYVIKKYGEIPPPWYPIL